MIRIGAHAVVLGASMSGLFAARVLSEFYDRVTVVERDDLGDEATARRGVPQSGQPHLLLARGSEITEELFPGVLREMAAAGAHLWDDGDLSRFRTYFGGHLIYRHGVLPNPRKVTNCFASRPFIEAHVRRRVRELSNVVVLDGHDVVDLIATRHAVTGVALHRRSDGAVSSLHAGLVVDATGRGSRTPAFFDRLGCARPEVDELAVRVAYASMPIRIPEGTLHEHLFFRQFEPGRPRGVFMNRCENGMWMIGVGTLGGAAPPSNRAELLDFAEELAPAHMIAAARAAEPLADVSVYRFPANRWRRYDKLAKAPDGLVVTGDAVCSFNPIYGQGMTIASIEAMILRDCLIRGDAGLPGRFHRAAAKTIRVAWQTAVGSDLALPEVPGRRTASIRITNAALERVLAAAESDPVVVQDFLSVTGMLEPPGRMLHPSFVFRVARAGRGRRDRQGEIAVSSLTSSA
jgi:2-polyprenyl-6-methoxyphenol hydroxylase-like FAD-dependent oxidoreductase